MFYIIYKITNLINNKIYIGYHSTLNLTDNYMGSGKIIKAAIKKHGTDSFTKEILHIFSTKEEALQKEMEIVNESFIKRDDTYNMKIGGKGGWDHTYSDPEISDRRKRAISLSFKEGRSTGWKVLSGEKNSYGFRGKRHTDDTKIKIGFSQKLPLNIIESRIKDYNQIEKTWGYKGKLANMWNISHTQVNRFIKNFC